LIATAAAASRTSKEIKQRFTCGSWSRIVSMLQAHHAPPRMNRIPKPMPIHPPGTSSQHPMVKPSVPVREIHKCPEPD
jgi:hypothetical protein